LESPDGKLRASLGKQQLQPEVGYSAGFALPVLIDQLSSAENPS